MAIWRLHLANGTPYEVKQLVRINEYLIISESALSDSIMN